MPVVAPAAAMEGRLINPESGLAKEIEVADDLHAVEVLDVGVVFASA